MKKIILTLILLIVCLAGLSLLQKVEPYFIEGQITDLTISKKFRTYKIVESRSGDIYTFSSKKGIKR